MSFRPASFAKPLTVLFGAVILWAQSAGAQLSKATQLILNRGIELQGMVEYADEFTLSTYSNANYTSVNWEDPSWNTYLGPAPGFPWGRWVSDPSDMPPQNVDTQYGYNNEAPYMNQLVDLELSDEPNLNDGPTLTNEINWFLSVESNYPSTILYINNYAGEASDQAQAAMITQGHCDLICFDEYPFTSEYNTNYTNDIGPAYTGPYTSWMSELRDYRQNAWAYGIPFGTYMQAFNSVEDYDTRVYRNPSPSEMRYNDFVALAFNAKLLIDFEYNAGATSLFNILPDGYSGDTYTNELYNEKADINHRATILGRSLACLQPIYDLHNASDSNPPPGPASGYSGFPDGTTTSILILKGNPSTSSNTPEPIGFQDSVAGPESYSWWEFSKNDPYLTNWLVDNLGTNNGGKPGQVVISWFRPLETNLEGPTYTNEIYMMVVNALTTTNGTAADCQQQITLFFMPALTAVDMLNLESGAVTKTSLPFSDRSDTERELVLDLNGGDAAFFKFTDGAPFIGHVPPAQPQLSATLSNGLPVITLQGTPLARYQLQAAPAPNSPNWYSVSNSLLTNSSAVFVDTWATNGNAVFYRAVGIP